eukprot:1069712-Amphidinium_carterae.1
MHGNGLCSDDKATCGNPTSCIPHALERRPPQTNSLKRLHATCAAAAVLNGLDWRRRARMLGEKWLMIIT